MPLSTISYKTWLNDISRVRNTNQADALLNTFVDVHVLCFFFFPNPFNQERDWTAELRSRQRARWSLSIMWMLILDHDVSSEGEVRIWTSAQQWALWRCSGVGIEVLEETETRSSGSHRFVRRCSGLLLDAFSAFQEWPALAWSSSEQSSVSIDAIEANPHRPIGNEPIDEREVSIFLCRIRTRVYAQGFVVSLLTAAAVYHAIKDRADPHEHQHGTKPPSHHATRHDQKIISSSTTINLAQFFEKCFFLFDFVLIRTNHKTKIARCISANASLKGFSSVRRSSTTAFRVTSNERTKRRV